MIPYKVVQRDVHMLEGDNCAMTNQVQCKQQAVTVPREGFTGHSTDEACSTMQQMKIIHTVGLRAHNLYHGYTWI